MKIRNLPFNKLNNKEKRVVLSFWEECKTGDKLCGNIYLYPCNDNVIDFWEEHREQDTENGTYNGWVEGNELEDIIARKLDKIKNESRKKNS